MTSFIISEYAAECGHRVFGFSEIGSTNTEAMTYAENSDENGVWFAALLQTSGRGRRGRVWQNPKGNLAASVIVRTSAEDEMLAGLSFVAGVSLHEAIRTVVERQGANISVQLKWPNDVLLGGAKLSGILLERKVSHDALKAVVVGIGVNVIEAPTDLPYQAMSLNEAGLQITAEELFTLLSEAWAKNFSIWNDGKGIGEILERWTKAAVGIGQAVSITNDQRLISGTFERIDEGGQMIVRTVEGHVERISAGDVHFGNAASARG